MDWLVRIACVFGELLGTHCGPSNGQSTFDPASYPATLIDDLHWSMYYGFGIVDAVLLGALAWALWRGVRRHRAEGARIAEPSPGTERRLVRATTVSAVVTVAILFTSLVASLAVTRAIDARTGSAIEVEVVGRQWWWEARYLDENGQPLFATANEIHIPVGVPVLLHLQSPDVIHSFWIPALHGKRDLIPGHHTTLTLNADRPGEYRGQCAEFCGLQHAHMAMLVIAQPREQYADWLRAQTQGGAPPAETREQAESLFASAGCGVCHTIRGTPANGETGPDLTTVGSRQAIAAGALPNTPEAMAAWIRDPQAVKPGTQMPANDLAPADLTALVTYLESLR